VVGGSANGVFYSLRDNVSSNQIQHDLKVTLPTIIAYLLNDCKELLTSITRSVTHGKQQD
jgi:hypothetical protein